MAWTLRVFDTLGYQLLSTVASDDEVPRISDGFRVTVRSSGDCVSLTFSGRNDLLGIQPRQIVQLLGPDDTPLFWGVITRCPNLMSRGAGPEDSGRVGELEEFVAEGGRALLAASQMGNRYINESWDVADLFREYLNLYAHPALRPELVGDVIETPGMELGAHYKPNAQLDVVLDELVGTVPGWVWGVNADGVVFLKELDGALAFQASELLDFVYRPVDAEDVVTKVLLVIAGSHAGRDPYMEGHHKFEEPPPEGSRWSHAAYVFDYLPRPIVFAYEHESHAVFRAERSFGLPEGLNPFLEPEELDPGGWRGTGEGTYPGAENPNDVLELDLAVWSTDGVGYTSFTPEEAAAVYDGDPTTFVSAPAGGGLRFRFRARAIGGANLVQRQPIVGYRVVHSGELFPGEEETGALGAIVPTNRVLFVQYVVHAPGVVDWGGLTPGSVAWQSRVAHDLRSVPIDSGGMGFYSVWPASVHFDDVNLAEAEIPTRAVGEVSFKMLQPITEVRLYAFYPLIMNHEFLTEVARANIRVPRAMPGDAVVEGYSPPVPVVSVEGVMFPGGTVENGLVGSASVADETTDAVDTIEYVMTTREGFMTRYIIGNDDTSEASKVLRRYIAEKMASQTYALTMAPRQ